MPCSRIFHPRQLSRQRSRAGRSTEPGRLDRLRRHRLRSLRCRHHGHCRRRLPLRLLQIASPDLATELAAIQYSFVRHVYTGLRWRRSAHALPPGFGFLVPRSEGKRMLAATFVHNKFPHRAPADRALIRCFLGGHATKQFSTFRRGDRRHHLVANFARFLALSAEPLFARVYKWKGAMAQYGVGHLERLQRIETLRQQLPGTRLGRQWLTAASAYPTAFVPEPKPPTNS